MEHLSKLIQAKRLPIYDILSSNCTISVKEDGNAFQIYKTENGDVVYGKRYNVPYKQAKPITEFDIASYSVYQTAVSHFSTYSMYKGILSFAHVKTFNFELIDTSVKHIVSNKQNKIVLLSAYTYEDKPVSAFELISIANVLAVEWRNVVFDGLLSEHDINRLLGFKESTEDIETRLWSYFKNKLFLDDNTEGIVLEFVNIGKSIYRMYKVQSPMFKEQITEHLNEEAQIRFNDVDDDIATKMCYLIRISYERLFDMPGSISGRSYFQVLLKLFEDIVNNEKDLLNRFFICNKISNFELLKNIPININYMQTYFADDYLKYKPYMQLLKYILLLFRTERTQQPLLCSAEAQRKVNETIRYLSFGTNNNMLYEIQKNVVQNKHNWVLYEL